MTPALERTTLRAYGRTVAFEVPASVTGHLLQRLPPTYRRSSGTPDTVFRLEPGGAPDALLSELELWVAEHARPWVFVHAGCVVWRGRAVLLPGRSMSGKSSLTAALVRAGATYFSDEYAVLGASGAVRPYARALSIRPYDGGAARRVPVSEYGGRAGSGPAAVGLVAHVRHTGSHGLEPVTRGQSVLHLLDNTVPARARPGAVLTALTAAVQGAVTVAGTRGDADETAALLLARLPSATDGVEG